MVEEQKQKKMIPHRNNKERQVEESRINYLSIVNIYEMEGCCDTQVELTIAAFFNSFHIS